MKCVKGFVQIFEILYDSYPARTESMFFFGKFLFRFHLSQISFFPICFRTLFTRYRRDTCALSVGNAKTVSNAEFKELNHFCLVFVNVLRPETLPHVKP